MQNSKNENRKGASTRYTHHPLSICMKEKEEKKKNDWNTLSVNSNIDIKDIIN